MRRYVVQGEFLSNRSPMINVIIGFLEIFSLRKFSQLHNSSHFLLTVPLIASTLFQFHLDKSKASFQLPTSSHAKSKGGAGAPVRNKTCVTDAEGPKRKSAPPTRPALYIKAEPPQMLLHIALHDQTKGAERLFVRFPLQELIRQLGRP